MPAQVLQGTLILPDRLVEDGQIVIDDGIIQEIVTDGASYQPSLDARKGYIAPGFIDLHVHGIAGADVMDASQDSLALMARRFAAHGVTGFLPTTVTERLDLTRRALAAISDYIASQDREPRGAQVLGIHLEGPWVSREYKGVQNERYIRTIDEETVLDLLAAARGNVTVVSLAPELPGADRLIGLLRDRGIRVSIAHTGATYEQARAAVDLGATQVTHCYNAMTGLHHRAPGVVGAALLIDDLFTELIADGIHVHPAAIALLIRVKGPERVMLVTDALSATELPDGVYQLGGKEVIVRDGDARLVDGTLASSTLTLDQAVRNLVFSWQVPLLDAIRMASTTPASALGLGGSKGKLEAGYDADVVVLDEGLEVRQTLVSGQRVT